MAMMEVNVVPLGTETPSVGDYVIRAVKVLKEARVKYEVTSMSTIQEKPLISYPRRLLGSRLKITRQKMLQARKETCIGCGLCVSPVLKDSMI